MTYMNRGDRRASIVEAAVEIILRDGLGATTVRGVAKALGASPGQIHHHFASADELRAEAFRTLWARTAPGFVERVSGMPPRERLLAALLADDSTLEALSAKLWNDSLVASGAEPHVRAAVREIMEQWLGLLVAAIKAGVDTGEFRSELSPEEIARRLAAFCLGVDVLASLGLPAHSRDEIRVRITKYIDLELGSPR
ncbi:TetR family transcriptional regulator C-terminal domain-containing protein [Geminicoccus flavidas]|uniref:TetR family transcriptional regulator C-terminal domain-containing protein n=1 Tax=Geminicoccus flavidas TaxID=2506407 RepID=UPI0013578474|nr:TetR family transcriptional regulator C-terminal domain-containing protein [Geminicoccus flavidas]